MTIKIAVRKGDITEFHADVIVNAANSTLFGGGGVDGAIHRVGGPIILAETQRIRESTLTDGLPAGEAVSTNAGNLPAKWIVHTVGPVWDADEDRTQLLESSYRKSMDLANKLGAHTIAFPAISAGAYGWPMKDAARIAVETVRSTDTKLTLATFVLFSDAAFAAFAAQL
jgi:O-acetyl-ADP-ribose deacetylase (regulator of RNase III)